MEPNSIVLVVLLFAAAAGLLVIIVRYRPIAARIGAGALALVLSSAGGMAIVNDYYGYYQTWSQMSADLSGSYSSFATRPVLARSGTDQGAGRLEAVPLPGTRSGISRAGIVYLPPQYFEPRFAKTRFPVVELVHGTPGNPAAWVIHLNIAALADRMIAEHLMGPTIFVMPAMSVGTNYEEGVDAPGALDDTYVTQDVRADVLAKFRASTDPAQWGIAGYSSGGYVAANLALRHPRSFGAAGIMDGYFRPQDGPAANALHHDPAAMAANDPLQLATALSRDASPLPAIWMSAGTGDAADLQGALAFSAALHGVEQVTLFRERGAGHNFYAWQPALPHLLAWMWTQLATPDLRVTFPVAGPVHGVTIKATNPLRGLALGHLGKGGRTAHRRHAAHSGHGAPTRHTVRAVASFAW